MANVIIRYLLDKDIIVLSTTSKKERMKSNQDVYSFSLAKEDNEKIASLEEATSSFFDNNSVPPAENLRNYHP